MERKNIIILLAIIIVLFMGILVYSQENSNKNTNTNILNTLKSNSSLYLINDDNELEDDNEDGNTPVNNPVNNPAFITGKTISLSELALHNTETDCWVIYNGKVYDLTTWLTKHPGGVKAISPYCGTQGFEAAFKAQHGNSKASLFMQVAKLMGDVEVKGTL